MGTFSYRKNTNGEVVTVEAGDYEIFGYGELTNPMYIAKWREYPSIGVLHNETGPAVEKDNGIKEWYLYGVKYTKMQWLNKLGK